MRRGRRRVGQGEGIGCRKALCVFDPGIEAGHYGKSIRSLRAGGVGYVASTASSRTARKVVDKGARAGQTASTACRHRRRQQHGLAKAISVLLTKPGKASDYVLAKPIYIDTKTPVFLVPTTAGTGSEITCVAVISRPDMNAKWSVFLNVNIAIVDPELTVTLPKLETATTGLDALSHAMEAMTGLNWNPHSDLVGEAAIKKIAKNLVTAYNEPDNIEARSEMMLADNFAGLAFNDPITNIGHAAADALSCRFHTPHGYNCAVSLPPAMALSAPAVPDKMRVIASAMGIALDGGETGRQLGELVAEAVRGLMRAVDIKPLAMASIASTS